MGKLQLLQRPSRSWEIRSYSSDTRWEIRSYSSDTRWACPCLLSWVSRAPLSDRKGTKTEPERPKNRCFAPLFLRHAQSCCRGNPALIFLEVITPSTKLRHAARRITQLHFEFWLNQTSAPKTTHPITANFPFAFSWSQLDSIRSVAKTQQ